jgi:PAS domain S-box-containing protein
MNPRALLAAWSKEIVFGARLGVPLLAVAILVPISFFSFLLFHTLAELVSIVIAVAAFIVAWNTYAFSRNSFLLFLGTGLLWLGALDLFHTLVYKGMQIYPGVTGANLPTQFWVGTRYLHALILLAAPLAANRPLRRANVLLGLGACSVLLWLWIMVEGFPDAFVEGQGLTPFKIGSEYVIVAILAGALLHLYHRRADFDGRILKLISASVLATMVAELAFTFYVSVYGLSNLVGHLFKILAYWYIYVALVEYALAEPFRLMAHGATTYEAIPHPTVVIDQDGLICQTNAAARQAIGLGADECIGRPCHELLHPRHLAIADCPACLRISTGTPAERIELEDTQQRRWTEITLSPVTWRGQAAGMVHVSRDITELKQAMIGLARSNTELQRFAEVAAHHLQEPVRRMASYAERLTTQLTGLLDDAEARLSLEYIGQQARREQSLLRDVERYLAASQPRGEVKSVDTRKVLDMALEDLAERIRAAGVEIVVGDLPPTRIDTLRLTDVFAVVLDNALSFGRGEHSPRIAVEGERTGKFVRFSVSDNGAGIAKDYRERVFRVFERLETGGEGTGIGLAILRRVAESTGGRAWIEDAPGGGCRVNFELPAGESS